MADAPPTLAWDMVTEVAHLTSGTLKLFGIPFRFSRTAAVIRRAPPLLGEHTDIILRKELGQTEEDIARLRASGVV